MLRISIAVVVAAIIAAIAALATEPVAAVGTRGPQPAAEGERFRAPQRDDCSFQTEQSSSFQQCPRNYRAPMHRNSEVRFASNSPRLTHDLGA